MYKNYQHLQIGEKLMKKEIINDKVRAKTLEKSNKNIS